MPSPSCFRQTLGPYDSSPFRPHFQERHPLNGFVAVPSHFFFNRVPLDHVATCPLSLLQIVTAHAQLQMSQTLAVRIIYDVKDTLAFAGTIQRLHKGSVVWFFLTTSIHESPERTNRELPRIQHHHTPKLAEFTRRHHLPEHPQWHGRRKSGPSHPMVNRRHSVSTRNDTGNGDCPSQLRLHVYCCSQEGMFPVS